MSIIQGQPPPYSEAQGITTVVTVAEQPSLLTLAAAHGLTKLDSAQVLEETSMLNEPIDLETTKINIYKHALFPLLALVFEKCEAATLSPDTSSEGIESELKACIKCLEGLEMDDDGEINELMVKAVQVLRIHLMEVEKVNELCKDFCARYTTCLKSKLTSESLLHVEGCDSPPPLDGSPSELNILSPTLMSSSPGVIAPSLQSPPSIPTANAFTPTVVNGSVVLQQQQTQIVSGNTVYQMVRTPQGIVAQPIQIQSSLTPIPTPNPTQPSIHGSTPLSQFGLSTFGTSPTLQQQQQQTPQQSQQQPTVQQPPSQPQPQSSSVSPSSNQQQQQGALQQGNMQTTSGMVVGLDEADDEEKNGKQKRGVLPKQATQIMKSWLFQHIVHPYPTEDEKRQIAAQTNLTLLQVNNWFINARRRILQPMLESSNPDKAKTKKVAKPVARPQNRFWPLQQSDIPPELSNSSVLQQQQQQSPLGADKDVGATSNEAGNLLQQQMAASSVALAQLSSLSGLASRTGQVAGAGAVTIGGNGAILNGVNPAGASLPSETLMEMMHNSVILRLGADGQLLPGNQVVPPTLNPASISLDTLQALQSQGFLFSPNPSSLNLSLPFNGLAPAVAGAGLPAFGMAGSFPGLAAAAAASIMNFNPAAAYSPLSFPNLNTTPIDLSSMANQPTIQFINGAASAGQINAQLPMQMGLTYQGLTMEQPVEFKTTEGSQSYQSVDSGGGGTE